MINDKYDKWHNSDFCYFCALRSTSLTEQKKTTTLINDWPLTNQEGKVRLYLSHVSRTPVRNDLNSRE